MELNTIYCGDAIEQMSGMPDGYFDSIVTDPPYGLKFMGKAWDHGIPGVPYWAEALRVAKPGAFLLAFGGTRTHHRLMVAIEDAGWEIRDCIMWVYGSGFPKSHDVSKAIDKAAGVERDVIGKNMNRRTGRTNATAYVRGNDACESENITAPATDAARQWDGWGTALKPAWEPVIVGYCPLTSGQFIGILSEHIRSQLCQCLPASDAEKSFIDTQAKSSEVARSVPEHARTYELANSGNVKFVAKRFTCPSAALSGATAVSAHENAKGNGNQSITLEAITLLGRVDAFLSQLLAISTSGTRGAISESTVLSWNNISDDLLSHASTFTTVMGIRLTTTLRTLSLCLSQTISDDTGNLSLNISPAWEPIIVARKPFKGTVAANVQEHGTGAMNIDGCRVALNGNYKCGANGRPSQTGLGDNYDPDVANKHSEQGRWPANLIHDGSDEVVGLMPNRKTTWISSNHANNRKGEFLGELKHPGQQGFNDSGSASRFFYQAKCSRSDRNEGLDSTCTVKYIMGTPHLKGGTTCQDVNMELVESLKKVTSELTIKWLIGESGESITGLCPRASLSTTLTEISKITISQILPLLTPSLINAFILDANSEMENGGNPAAGAEKSSASLPIITNEIQPESARGASHVVSEMLLIISDAENWNPLTNTHSTVKPTALMRYLCRLVTQPGGVILDPFCGSGSTGKAAIQEGFSFIGVDNDADTCEIAQKRVDATIAALDFETWYALMEQGK